MIAENGSIAFHFFLETYPSDAGRSTIVVRVTSVSVFARFSFLGYFFPSSVLSRSSEDLLVLPSSRPALCRLATRCEDYWISCHFQKKYALFTLTGYEGSFIRCECVREIRNTRRSRNESTAAVFPSRHHAIQWVRHIGTGDDNAREIAKTALDKTLLKSNIVSYL